MGVGGLLQALVAFPTIRSRRADLHAQWRSIVLSGVAVGGYPLAFYTSMRLAGVAVGTVVSIGSAPLAAVLVERVVDRQPISPRWALGGCAGVLGLAALAFAQTSRTRPGAHDFGSDPMAGMALGLLAGLAYALYSWGAARVMRRGLPTAPVMGSIFGVGGVLLLPVLLVTGAPIIATWRNFGAAAYLAVVPMFVGYRLFGRDLSAIGASAATTLSLLEPAVAAVLAVLVLHERLSPLGWAGMAVMAAALLLVTVQPSHAPQLPLAPQRRGALAAGVTSVHENRREGRSQAHECLGRPLGRADDRADRLTQQDPRALLDRSPGPQDRRHPSNARAPALGPSATPPA
jgi:DME family drug/metabolite transporter